MQWSDLVERTDIMGGVVEAEELGHQFRGPIAEVIFDRSNLIVKAGDLTRLNLSTKQWEPEESMPGFNGWSVNIDHSKIEENQEGIISFYIPYIGKVKIYPFGLTPPPF